MENCKIYAAASVLKWHGKDIVRAFRSDIFRLALLVVGLSFATELPSKIELFQLGDAFQAHVGSLAAPKEFVLAALALDPGG